MTNQPAEDAPFMENERQELDAPVQVAATSLPALGCQNDPNPGDSHLSRTGMAGSPKRAALGWFPSRHINATVVMLVSAVALALVLRLLFLGAQSLWLDEAWSIWVAQLRWPQFVDTLLHGDANMSLYYTLFRVWLHLGRDEFLVRSLSVIFSVATVPVVFTLGTRMFGVRAGLIAALLMAVNAYHIQYAQEARSYSLVVFLVSLASLYYVISIERSSRITWIAYVVTGVLAVYSHLFAVFVLAAHWVSLSFLRPREVPWKAVARSVLTIGLLLLPLGVVVVSSDNGQISWILRPKLDAVPRALAMLSGAGGSLPFSAKKMLVLPERGRYLLLLAYFGFCTAALTRGVKSWLIQRRSVEVWRYSLVVLWLSLPPLLAFGISFVKPIFVYYYLIVSLPPLMLLAAIGLSMIQPRSVFLCVLAVVIGLASHEVFSYYTYAKKEDWRGATTYVLSHVRPGDTLVLGRFARPPFEYYRDQLAGSDNMSGVAIYSEDFQVGSNRVWFISRVVEAQTPLAKNYVVIHREAFSNVQVVLYGPRSSP